MIETKLTIVFDKKKLKAAGKTEEDYMGPIRKAYEGTEVREIKHNVFVMAGEKAAVTLYSPLADIIDDDRQFVEVLKRCILDMGNEVDDVIKGAHRWYEKCDRIYGKNTNQDNDGEHTIPSVSIMLAKQARLEQ